MTQQYHFWDITEDIQNMNLKRYTQDYVHCSIIYNSQDMEAIQVPINRQLNRHSCTVEYYSAIKNEILPFATTCTDLEHIMLSVVSLRENNKHCMIS